MAVEIKEGRLFVTDTVSIEALDELIEALETLKENSSSVLVDLSECRHMHTAAVQLLMTSASTVVAWPQPSEWQAWLRAGLET